MIGARCLAGREAGLILAMFGVIQKKIVVCYSGLGKSGTNGSSDDTMFVVTNLVIVTTGGGNRSLMNWLRALA
jgi:hypothetical protein